MATALVRGKMMRVRNLGWLLRNWKRASSFKVSENPKETVLWDALLQAFDRDGILIYETDFASRSVLWDFLRRPVFKGCELCWFGEKTVVGATKDGMITDVSGTLFRALQRQFGPYNRPDNR